METSVFEKLELLKHKLFKKPGIKNANFKISSWPDPPKTARDLDAGPTFKKWPAAQSEGPRAKHIARKATQN